MNKSNNKRTHSAVVGCDNLVEVTLIQTKKRLLRKPVYLVEYTSREFRADGTPPLVNQKVEWVKELYPLKVA